MIAIRLEFPGGRYHATPWGRHVNEGEVEWPPSPWRLLRALVAVWHAHLESLGVDESVAVNLIQTLAESAPEYRVPPAAFAHTRHYMPQGQPAKTSLVIDAFAGCGSRTEHALQHSVTKGVFVGRAIG